MMNQKEFDPIYPTMNQKEFDAIYPEWLDPIQHKVLNLFLQGKSETAIAEYIEVNNPSSVRYHISKICRLFGFENDKGKHLRQRDKLIWLFAKHRPDLVSSKHPKLIECGANTSKRSEVPGGPVPLNSDFYIERSTIESDCYQQILGRGSMIRIKGPKLIGKTSLLNRLMKRAETNKYRLVSLDFSIAEEEIFCNRNEFFKWFCWNISQQLKLESNCIDKYLQAGGGILVNCKKYFQSEVLEAIDCPLVLALEEIDCIFRYEEIAGYFLSMLRSWFEETKKTEIWENLRMVILHSTNVYVELPVNQSPFNVGFPVELTEFNQPNILDLARRHQLSWETDEVMALMTIVGGYPYLVHMALYHLNYSSLSLAEILQNAATDVGIYREHLKDHWAKLQKYSELKTALKQVVLADSSVKLEQVLEFKLLSTGLVKQNQHGITPSCQLYRDYFAEKFRD